MDRGDSAAVFVVVACGHWLPSQLLVVAGHNLMRPCLGCRRLCKGTRCTECQRAWDRARNASPARRERYGKAHRLERAQWAPIVSAGGVACSRCGQPIDSDGEWELDHLDGMPSHPAHPRCNAAAGGRTSR